MRRSRIPDDKFDCYESREVCRLSASYLAAVHDYNVARRTQESAGGGFVGDHLSAELAFHAAAIKVITLAEAWIHAVDAFEAAMKAEEPQP